MTYINEIININHQLIDEIIKTSFSEENKFGVTDRVVLGLFKSLNEKGSSLLYLFDNKMFAGNDTLLRTVFETSIHLQFILNKDTDIRAKAYNLSSKIKMIKITEQSMANDEKGRAIRKYSNQTIENLQRVYSLTPDVERTKEEYKNLVGNLNADKWYSVNGGPSSFERVCESLGDLQLAEYEIIYRNLSQETHGKEAGDYFKVSEGYVYLDNLHESEMLIPMLRGIIGNSAKLIAERYDKMDFIITKMGPIAQKILSNK